MRPQSFKVISGDTFYMGKEGSESEAGRLHVGSVLWAAVANESRTLGGERVRVVLFKIGTDGKDDLQPDQHEWPDVGQGANGNRVQNRPNQTHV
jgi:hypothetical protein